MNMKMKTKSLLTVSFIVGTFLCGSLLNSCDSSSSIKSESINKQDSEKVIPSIQVKNELVESEMLLEGKIAYRTVKDLTFSVGGILEAGDVVLKSGSEFKFNELLFKLNLKDAFALLSAKKKDLATSFNSFLRDLNTSGTSSQQVELINVDKWKTFAAQIKPEKRLPKFPTFRTKTEENLLLENNLFVQYDEVQQLEQEIEHYFYLAPFDGIVLSIKSKVGNRIKPNHGIARIAKKGEYTLVVRVEGNQGNPSSSLEVFNDTKESIGRATFMSAKNVGNQKELSFSIKLNKGVRTEIGQSVYVKTNFKNQKACYLPKSAVDKNSVNIWENGKKLKKNILVLKEEENRFLVSGLKDGEVVLLDN